MLTTQSRIYLLVDGQLKFLLNDVLASWLNAEIASCVNYPDFWQIFKLERYIPKPQTLYKNLSFQNPKPKTLKSKTEHLIHPRV